MSPSIFTALRRTHDIIADGKPEELNRLDEVLKRLVVAKVLDRIGPGAVDPGSKDLGRSDPEAVDELAEVVAKLYQQDTGISIYLSSGRFDMQFYVKRLR